MLKPILIGGLLGLFGAPIVVALIVYAIFLFSEWYYQPFPNWDIAWRVGHGYVTFLGAIAAILGFPLGMLAGRDWFLERKKGR